MADQIHLQIVTAGGVVFDRMVQSVRLPLESGSIGVLANHAPLIGAVVDGVVTCASSEGEFVIAVGIGVVNVVNNTRRTSISPAPRLPKSAPVSVSPPKTRIQTPPAPRQPYTAPSPASTPRIW